MASTSAFQLHTTISTNARSQLTQAVSLDEQNLTSDALNAYKRAASLIHSYVQAFSPGAPGYLKLATSERHVVNNTRVALAQHLQGLQSRVHAITSSSSGSIPRARTGPPSSEPVKRVPSLPVNDGLRLAIESEILDDSPKVSWDDIYGLEIAKDALNEMVVLPAQRPDLYTGLRAPGKGVLLFGPPGTGKTMIAKAVASNADATFFSISASSLNSKFHGESERLVRALFTVARERQPSFIFIDEVDSILGSRSDNEHEASRRLKTEFMAQFDGAGGVQDRVYVMAASNRPQDLDDAVRRRLDRRIYIGLPDKEGRQEFLRNVTRKNGDVKWALSKQDFAELAQKTERFSGSDIKALCREASLMPLRELGSRVSDVRLSEVRGCTMSDFEEALQIVRPSSDAKMVRELREWDEKFGSKPTKPGVLAGSLKESVGVSNTGTRAAKGPKQAKSSEKSKNQRAGGLGVLRPRRKPKS